MKGISIARADSPTTDIARRRATGRRRDGMARRADDLAAHRATLGIDHPERACSSEEVRRAFTRAARRFHPDVGRERCGGRFRDAVRARDALLARDGMGGGRTFVSAVSRRGGGNWAYAGVMATPFFIAALVSVALPKSTEGARAGMGRVHGALNPPVNEWLKDDLREYGDGNKERFWVSGRVNPKSGTERERARRG